jgi:pantothenate kinase
VIEDVEENSSLCEYGEILKILNEYLPVSEFTDQQVPLEKLAEYFGDEQEARFKELLGQVGNNPIPAEENLV